MAGLLLAAGTHLVRRARGPLASATWTSALRQPASSGRPPSAQWLARSLAGCAEAEPATDVYRVNVITGERGGPRGGAGRAWGARSAARRRGRRGAARAACRRAAPAAPRSAAARPRPLRWRVPGGARSGPARPPPRRAVRAPRPAPQRAQRRARRHNPSPRPVRPRRPRAPAAAPPPSPPPPPPPPRDRQGPRRGHVAAGVRPAVRHQRGDREDRGRRRGGPRARLGARVRRGGAQGHRRAAPLLRGARQAGVLQHRRRLVPRDDRGAGPRRRGVPVSLPRVVWAQRLRRLRRCARGAHMGCGALGAHGSMHGACGSA
jgi:hypothetical protein